MKRLGERIKRKRESQSLQLNDLAKKVGISSSGLSQIENSKSTPSIVTLKTIAENLHTTVGELIGENEALSNNPLVRFEEKRFIEQNESGTKLFLLSNHGNNKLMDTYLLDFQENSDAENLMKTHPGQEFCFVLEGELEMLLDGKTYVIKKNDSFYFNSGKTHFAKNRAKGLTQVIWVVSPPEGY